MNRPFGQARGHTVPGPHRAPIVLGRTARLLRTRTVTEQLLGLPVTD
jgi:hypothetical protein